MVTSISTIARRICHSVGLPKLSPCHLSKSLCTMSCNEDNLNDTSFSSQTSPSQPRTASAQLLENGVDNGIYRAILVGEVGQRPLQKVLNSGKKFVIFSVGTGGIHNNRTPLMQEDPKDYANRCSVQWHRVCIYQDFLLDMVMKNVVPGTILYLEGNLETRVFTDQVTGLARRLREIAIRRDGRIVFLGKGEDNPQPTQEQPKGVGYF